MNGIIRAAINRPIATLLAFAGVLILGALAVSGMSLEYLPELAIPKLSVATTYQGLPASEVRTMITIPLEDQLASVKGVKRITSVSRDGLCIISLEFGWAEEMTTAAVRTREAIDIAYGALPSEAAKPQVFQLDPGEKPLVTISVMPQEGNSALARRLAEREIKMRLQQVDGVGSIVLTGGSVEEILISADTRKLAAKGLRLSDISDLVAKNNYDYPAGTIVQGGFEYLVKVSGTVKDADSLGKFRFPGKFASLKLSDVANIETHVRERDSFFQINGDEAIGLAVMKRKGANPIAVASNVKREVDALAAAYKADVKIEVAFDSSGFISTAIRNLILEALAGAFIAFLVLIAFIRDLRTSMILMLSIPIAVTAALLALRVCGRSINVMTLGGLALGIGMIVDHSVVVLENLQKRHTGIVPCITSVLAHTLELGGSNIGSTITAVVVFLPVIFLPGLLGSLFTDLSLAVIFAQIASFFTSVTLMPVLFLITSRAKKLPVQRKKQPVTEIYFRRALRLSLRRPILVAVVVSGITLVGAWCLMALKFDFMPAQEIGEIEVTVTMPYSTYLEKSARVAADVAKSLKGVKGIYSILARGGGEPDDAQYYADPEARREIIHIRGILSSSPRPSAFTIVEAVRKGLKIEGAKIDAKVSGSTIAELLGNLGQERTLVIKGNSQEEARRRAVSLERIFLNTGKTEVIAASTSILPDGNRAQILLDPDREAISYSGLALSDIAETVAGAIEGSYPSQVVIGGRDVKVRVRAGKDRPERMEDIAALPIALSNSFSKVASFIKVREDETAPALYRRDRADTVMLKVQPLQDAKSNLESTIKEIDRRFDWAESLELSILAENMTAILMIFALVMVLLYLVLGAQFESFLLPCLLLSALPLSFAGITVALFITGKPISFDSMLGIIVLFGIAVNNSLILYVTYSNRRAAAFDVLASVYRGTIDRLRPILITMMITVFSLLPIAVDLGHSSSESGMAVAIIGGLFVSTILTLFVVPQVFLRYLRGGHGRSA